MFNLPSANSCKLLSFQPKNKYPFCSLERSLSANRFLSSQPSVCLVWASYEILFTFSVCCFLCCWLGFVFWAGGGWGACIRLFSPLTHLFVRLCCVFLQSFALHSSLAVHFFTAHSIIVVWAGIICSFKFKNVLKASTKLIYFVEYRRTKPTAIKAFHSLCKRTIHFSAMVYIKQGFLITTKVLFLFHQVIIIQDQSLGSGQFTLSIFHCIKVLSLLWNKITSALFGL